MLRADAGADGSYMTSMGRRSLLTVIGSVADNAWAMPCDPARVAPVKRHVKRSKRKGAPAEVKIAEGLKSNTTIKSIGMTSEWRADACVVSAAHVSVCAFVMVRAR